MASVLRNSFQRMRMRTHLFFVPLGFPFFAPRICSLFLSLLVKYEFEYRLATSCHFQSHKTDCRPPAVKDTASLSVLKL
jgi:hypothetical protein